MEDDIIVVGCDGLWDTDGLTIDDFMSDVLQPHWDNPDFDLAKCATDYALAKGSTDNVTVLTARVTPWAPTLKTQKTEPLSPSLFKKV
jgi:serine/threonine protein phosphatase PrpC